MADAVGHEDRQDDEPRHVEDELRDKHRPQQRMAEDECGTLLDLLQRMAARDRLACRLKDPRQQHDRDDRERRSKAEGRARADPADQHAAQRRAAGEGHGAGELDPSVGGRQRMGRHQRRHQRWRGNAIDDSAADGDEAQQSQQWQVENTEPECGEDRQQGAGTQRFCTGHQPAARQAIGQHARRDGEQHDGR